MIVNDFLKFGDRVRNEHVPRSTRTLTNTKGVSGTQNIGGQITDEDENEQWSDPVKRIKNVDLMRKTCVRTRQSMMILKSPILGATMMIEPASDSPIDMKIAQFVEQNMFDSHFFRWDDVLRQQMTYLDFGASILEKQYLRLEGRLHWSKLAFRLPHTIFEWDVRDEILQEVRQTNIFSSEKQPQPMLAEQIIHTAYEQEGENYAGFSALRPAWINWKAKMFLVKGDMVRYERWGIGTPMITTDSNEIPQDAIDAVQAFRANEEGFLGKTKKWALEVFGGGRNSGLDIKEMVMWHDHQIVFNVMANFMATGEATVGSFALTKVSADMFFNNVEREARHIENVWNEPFNKMVNIPQLVRLNFGENVIPSKLRIENLELNDLEGLAERSAKYISSGLLDATPDMKRHIREREKYPLTDLDNEQLENLVNINPTIKRIDNGMPYVLQYSKKRNKILRLERAQTHCSHGSKLTMQGRQINVAANNVLETIQSKKNRRGKKMTEELLKLEKKIVDVKGIEKFLDGIKGRMEKIAQRHRDDFIKFLVKEGEKILIESNTVAQVESKLNEVELDIDLFIEQIDKEANKVFRFGIEQIKKEIKKQGVSGLFNLGDPIIEDSEEAKKAVRASIAIGLAGFMSKTINEWRQGVFDLYKRAELSTDFIRTRLQRVSQKVLNSKLGSIINNSFGIGRGVQMHKIRSKIKRIIHTEVLDEDTCAPCMAADGLEFKSMDDPEFSKFSNGQNPDCLGDDRCRGFNFIEVG